MFVPILYEWNKIYYDIITHSPVVFFFFLNLFRKISYEYLRKCVCVAGYKIFFLFYYFEWSGFFLSPQYQTNK